MNIRISFKDSTVSPLEQELSGEIRVRKHQSSGDQHAFLELSAEINKSNLETVWASLQSLDALSIATFNVIKDTSKVISITNPINLNYTKTFETADKELISVEC